MKIHFLSFFFLFVCATGLSQTEVLSTEEWYVKIEAAPNDTTKVWLYDKLFLHFFFNREIDSLKTVAEKGLQLAKLLDHERGLAKMNYYIAKALEVEGESAESLLYFNQTLIHLRNFKDPELEAKTYLNMGAAYYFIGDVDLALEHYFKANDIYEQTDKKNEHARLLNNIGVIYRMQEKYDRAKEIYQKSYDLKLALNDSAGMAASLHNIGLLHSHMESSEENGITYLQQSLQLYEQLNRPEDIASCYTSIGNTCIRLERWKEAKIALEEAWKYYENQPVNEYTITTLGGLGRIAEHKQEFVIAEMYFQKGTEVSRQLQQKNNLLGLLLNLSDIQFQQQKNHDAYKNLEEAFTLQESLSDEQRLASMEEMQAKFDVQQKEAELKISQLELSERTKQRNLFRIGALLLAIMAVIIFFGLRSRIKINQEVAQQKATLQKQRINQLEQEKKLAAINAMLEGEEKERTRIANDLHDGLGGVLAAVKSYFNSFSSGLEERQHFTKTNQLIDDACIEVRRISHNMMPRSLSLLGLSGALEDLAQDVRQKGLNCDLELIGLDDVDFPQIKTTNFYRIIQELTNNVLKHAEAKNLLLQVIHRTGKTTILVEDDGKGFDTTKAFQQKGLGLSSINARVEFMEGQIHWDAVPDEGTSVSVQL